MSDFRHPFVPFASEMTAGGVRVPQPRSIERNSPRKGRRKGEERDPLQGLISVVVIFSGGRRVYIR